MPRKDGYRPLTDLPLLVLDGEPATLVAADVHLGFERYMSRRGIFLPSRSRDPGELLAAVARAEGCGRIILLGDVKHRIPGPTTPEAFALRDFFRALLEAVERVDVCPGNHDGGLAAEPVPGVTFHDPRGFTDGTFGFIHGHTWPDPSLLACRVMVTGHAHPRVWFRDSLGTRTTEPCWLRAAFSPRKVYDGGVERRVYPKGALSRRPPAGRKGILLVMPALSPYGQGCAVNHGETPLPGPLGKGGLVDVEGGDVYLLSGVHLGRAGRLPRAEGPPEPAGDDVVDLAGPDGEHGGGEDA